MRAGWMRRGGGQMHFEGENTISSQLSGKRLFIYTEMVQNREGDYTDSCQSEQSCAVYKKTKPTKQNAVKHCFLPCFLPGQK
jgi:hypothetical protein